MPFYIAHDGYGDLALREADADLVVRKCDLPPATRDRVQGLLLDALDPFDKTE